MISVEEARARIVAALGPSGTERVPLEAAQGRVLAEAPASRVTQPPADLSAMDGYAVRAADCAQPGATLRIVGEVPAGALFNGTLGAGEAVRIFTGAALPAGADSVAVQEDCTADARQVQVTIRVETGSNVRKRGNDFAEGETPLTPGTRLEARHLALAAAMNHPGLRVWRRPRIGILQTGDEILAPGDPARAGAIYGANAVMLAAIIRRAGGEPINLGIAPDREAELAAMADLAEGLDLLVTSGGASVGDHDLVQGLMSGRDDQLDFWKIRMKPGKPLMFGRRGATPLLGLPGNPVSSYVCGLLFVVPALQKLCGMTPTPPRRLMARLAVAIGPGGKREDYQRARLDWHDDGLSVTPFDRQDSAQLGILAAADALLVRPASAQAEAPGAMVPVLPLDGLFA